MTRRRLAVALVLAAIAGAAVAAARVGPTVRDASFHLYADHRAWHALPHAGDVLSNLGFLIACAALIPLGAAQRRASARFATAAAIGVGAIGVGSAAYHTAPGDALLALDWAPIVVTLALMNAAVIDDRIGPRAGGAAAIIGPLAAVAVVALWYAQGGTVGGGDMTPYGAFQLLALALPLLVALVAPGRIPVAPLAGAVVLFAAARLLAARDAELLAATGVSGHSLKHVAAALAAACGLYALRTPRRAPPPDAPPARP